MSDQMKRRTMTILQNAGISLLPFNTDQTELNDPGVSTESRIAVNEDVLVDSGNQNLIFQVPLGEYSIINAETPVIIYDGNAELFYTASNGNAVNTDVAVEDDCGDISHNTNILQETQVIHNEESTLACDDPIVNEIPVSGCVDLGEGPSHTDHRISDSDEDDVMLSQRIKTKRRKYNNLSQTSSSNSSITFFNTPTKLKSKRQIMRERRAKGESYEARTGKLKQALEFKYLSKCCKKECYKKVTECSQRKIFNDFNKIALRNDQVLADMIDIFDKQCERKGRGKSNELKNRQITISYRCLVDGAPVIICKTMFQHIYSVSKNKVDLIVAKKRFSETGIIEKDGRGRHEPINKNNNERKLITEHINSYPKYTSHYTRKHTSKLYFSPQLNIKRLYEMYCEKRRSEGSTPASYSMYATIFKELGFKFKQPSKDTCKKCDLLDMKSKSAKTNDEKEDARKEKDEHLELAQKAYDAKKADKDISMDNENMRVIVFDLEQCLPTPSLNTSVVYYKRQLWTFNLTVRDCTAKETSCYMWHEGVGQRGGNDISSCVITYLKTLPNSVKHVVLYSDNCPGQNKNLIVSAALSLFVSRSDNLEIVDHKFLVSGHTRLECDSDHARIERSKKNTEIEIRIPHDWYQFIRTIRGDKPFKVIEMTQELFLSYSSLIDKYLTRNLKTVDGVSVKWSNICWLRYEKEFGLIKVKYSLDNNEEFQLVDIRKKRRTCKQINNDEIEIPKCYNNPLPVGVEKKKDLLSLLPLIDPVYHSFYQNLRTTAVDNNVGEFSDSEHSN